MGICSRYHKFIRGIYNVTHRRAEVIAYGIKVYIGIGEFQVSEEDAVERIVVILSRVCKECVEVVATLVYHGRKTNNLGACAYYDKQFKTAIILKTYVVEVEF